MFKKILIANRGEIACRVMRTAREMGISCVAVYSEADRDALHVRLADEAHEIGGAQAQNSYLNIQKIIDVARQTKAEAIHPGYGFLSENADFIEACQAAGITFIGPSADAVRAMGLKDRAKALMEQAGVPVVPGYYGARQEPEFLLQEAERIGYPVLIKACAGGGGKGMRRVDDRKNFASALKLAQEEALSSFGNAQVIIEKYITAPRHIEVQIFSDRYGHYVHMYERDCSMQRRHQKVIEEAPAPGMTEKVREALCSAAIQAAQSVSYEGAGTVEFIADGSDGLKPDGFWFMEMNTRLQVEHPVTEAVTGLDLVEWQLRVAAGEPLPLQQKDIPLNGAAFEARLYAEDPAKNFMPSIGKLSHIRLPEGSARIETGVRGGSEISPFYDPMIAKVIVHGKTREEAQQKLVEELGKCEVIGCTTNIDFLYRLAQHPDFSSGRVDTGLIEREFDKLIGHHRTEISPYGEMHPDVVEALSSNIAFAVFEALDLFQRSTNPEKDTVDDVWSSLKGWRHWGAEQYKISLLWRGSTHQVFLTCFAPGRYQFLFEGDPFITEARKTGTEAELKFDHGFSEECLKATVIRQGYDIHVFRPGAYMVFSLPSFENVDDAGSLSGNAILAPLPGIVKSVHVKMGDDVRAGQSLLVIEAMKMQHNLTAHRDGHVTALHVAPYDQVTEGAVLLEFEPQSGDV